MFNLSSDSVNINIRPLAENNQDEFINIFENDGKFINKINVFGHFEIGFNNLCALEGEYLLQFDLNGKPVKENELIRTNEQYKKCQSLEFKIGFSGDFYFFDNLNVYVFGQNRK